MLRNNYDVYINMSIVNLNHDCEFIINGHTYCFLKRNLMNNSKYFKNYFSNNNLKCTLVKNVTNINDLYTVYYDEFTIPDFNKLLFEEHIIPQINDFNSSKDAQNGEAIQSLENLTIEDIQSFENLTVEDMANVILMMDYLMINASSIEIIMAKLLNKIEDKCYNEQIHEINIHRIVKLGKISITNKKMFYNFIGICCLYNESLCVFILAYCNL